MRPSASLERNEGGARSPARKNTHSCTTLYTGKGLLFDRAAATWDSCVHQIAQVNASLTRTNTLKRDKSKLDIKPK